MARLKRLSARRVVALLALIILAAWFVPSFFSAGHYRRRLRAGLAETLDRSVDFGAVSFRLLPRPGFRLQNLVVGEAPAFGSEPFAIADLAECDLRWRSLWRSKLECSRLDLDRATFNLVRNSRGEWNVETLLAQVGLLPPNFGPSLGSSVESAARRAGGDGSRASWATLAIAASDARLNFKVGADKKPLAITDVRLQIELNSSQHRVAFRLAGSPIRTDLSLPTPGPIELDGEWSPAADSNGKLNATLHTEKSLLYDWMPIVVGRNPEVYGVLASDVHISGSLADFKMEGNARLSQLHRWELVPPSDLMPVTLRFRGEFDRRRGRLAVETLAASFGRSSFHVSGSVEQLPSSPQLNLVLSLDGPRLEDIQELARRFGADSNLPLAVSGRVEGTVTAQGAWRDLHYDGLATARDVEMKTKAGNFPASVMTLHLGDTGAHLSPFRIAMGPHVEVTAEGWLDRGVPAAGTSLAARRPRTTAAQAKRPSGPNPELDYRLVLSTKSAPLGEVLGLVRRADAPIPEGVDAKGLGSATVRVTGSAWPLGAPTLEALAEMRGAQWVLPGLVKPLEVTRADLGVVGDHIVVSPALVHLGDTTFSGKLERSGPKPEPWRFEIVADHLSLEEGASWFEALGKHSPFEILQQLPVLGDFARRREEAARLLAGLDAEGTFESPLVSYRAVSLKDFRASLSISGKVIRVTRAQFVTGGGRGEGSGRADLTASPPRLAGNFTATQISLQALGSKLPANLQKMKGTFSVVARFETRGTRREELAQNLEGPATITLKNVSTGDLDLVGALVRANGWGRLQPARQDTVLRSVVCPLEVHGQKVAFNAIPLEVDGAKLELSGTYVTDGKLDLTVNADLRHLTRRWLDSRSPARLGDFHFRGTAAHLDLLPEKGKEMTAPVE